MSRLNQVYSFYKTMLFYYLKRRKTAGSKGPKRGRTKIERIMLLSKSAVCY